jgi:tetratricopeptide (TPR) repeat protein
METNFEKANEIYFRLGIIYKQQGKYDMSLQCFRYILSNPPKPLTEMDIWFQIGHVHEQQKEVRVTSSKNNDIIS